ncbi:hypothetical protein BGZ70_003016 [Mortierella alpina]|uniref:MHD domain-containing protein n=1 Tax=Mortierella alpina TaxID=64518 RepID=A0A9P6JAY7_MORAP|nr:hypothetical protein BGZ70_003016 [Mortierella alpina]
MISALFIYNQKGEVLISRLYRQDLKRSIADIFRIQVISNTDVRSPIITLGSTSFFHVRHENLYIVALTKWNANAALIFESYFGKFDEEAVKANFVLIYELLDEVLDFGYPQNSEADTLKMYITTESVKSERAIKEDSAKITIQATGATSWRRSDVKYRKNEAFIDVIESVNLLLSAQGNVLRADVAGQIMMRAYLSGTPECKFGLNDKVLLDKDPSNRRKSSNTVEIDDCQFHQCVKLGRFDSDRTISFIPPDGEFELMRYRTSDNINLPFKVHPVVTEIGKSKIEYRILIKANFSSKLYANNVVLNIPTPLNTAGVTCSASAGKAKYVPADNSIVWKISRFQGQSEYTLTGEASLTAMTHKKAWSRPPISMDFQVLMFTSSGLLVRFLKVFEKNNYQSVKWVRYMTKAGNYQIRNWPAENYSPFGVYPVLHIKTGTGLEVKLAETLVIEQYLAKKFGLLGDNEWEEQQIKMFHSSSLYVRERLFMRVTWNYKEVMAKALDLFLTQHLPLWIETHTKHLKDNGSNGHYVGDKISLADILTANAIDHFAIQYGGPQIIELVKKSPEIWKVKEKVDAEPRLQAWRQSEGYKSHVRSSVKMYANTGM